ncbi:hypothetical protein BU23DRAFT_575481 [Bimuria novae-zelandiae CBS 107.79]|uniref:Uncharacterized protein n=1 Tax=Bimuria novae-zelandiae CBS 107.79 TaxID=1447943 RepID=A0A6A5ULR6_9PLEO|nr:hypothetical protein BU23DRAFT_575481 [Bimuria novae-zelandiae CBS 107.79]
MAREHTRQAADKQTPLSCPWLYRFGASRGAYRRSCLPVHKRARTLPDYFCFVKAFVVGRAFGCKCWGFRQLSELAAAVQGASRSNDMRDFRTIRIAGRGWLDAYVPAHRGSVGRGTPNWFPIVQNPKAVGDPATLICPSTVLEVVGGVVHGKQPMIALCNSVY